MQGKILAYSNDVTMGLIESASGDIYAFRLQHWMHRETPPNMNMRVTFEVHQGKAEQVSQTK